MHDGYSLKIRVSDQSRGFLGIVKANQDHILTLASTNSLCRIQSRAIIAADKALQIADFLHRLLTQLQGQRLIAVINHGLALQLPSRRSLGLPISISALNTLHHILALEAAHLHDNGSLIGFLQPIRAQQLQHFLGRLRASSKIIGHISSIILLSVQACIDQNHRQLSLAQLLHRRNQLHAVRGSQNHGIGLLPY